MSASDQIYKYSLQELLEYAIKHILLGDDFNVYVGFLLLDVSVEGLLKAFLTAPSHIAKKTRVYAKDSEAKWEQIALDGNFHQLVTEAKKCHLSPHTFDWNKIEDFHNLRNKLYHQGVGLTVRKENALSYAKLATDLSIILMDIDVSDVIEKPNRIKKQEETIEIKHNQINGVLNELNQQLDIIIDYIAPEFLRPTKKRIMNKYYVDFSTYDAIFTSRNKTIEKIQLIHDFVLSCILPNYLTVKTNNPLDFIDGYRRWTYITDKGDLETKTYNTFRSYAVQKNLGVKFKRLTRTITPNCVTPNFGGYGYAQAQKRIRQFFK